MATIVTLPIYSTFYTCDLEVLANEDLKELLFEYLPGNTITYCINNDLFPRELLLAKLKRAIEACNDLNNAFIQ
jgi:hypothetical protein